MRELSVILAVLAIAVTCQASEGKTCLLTATAGKGVHNVVAEMALSCLVLDKNELPNASDLVTLDEYSNFTKSYCEKLPRYQACLDDVTHQSQICQNETRHEIFLSLKEVLEKIFDISCHKEGSHFAELLYGIENISWQDAEGPGVGTCFRTAKTMLNGMSFVKNIEPTATLFVLYKEVNHFKDCIQLRDHGNSGFWVSVQLYLNGILEIMKCPHPNGNERVLCSSLTNHAEIEAAFCPIKRQEDDPSIKYTILRDLQDCLKGEDYKTEESKDLDWYRTYFRRKCHDKEDIRKCVITASLMSWVCLNEKDTALVHWGVDSLRTVVGTGCLDEGEPLAVIFANYSHAAKSASESGTTDDRCLFPAGDVTFQENPVFDENLMKVEFYKSLILLRDCHIRKQHDNNMVIFYLELLFNEVLADKLCFHPETGKDVRCQTLESTSVTPEHHCHFKKADGGDEALFSQLVDMSYVCALLNEEKFYSLDENITLGHIRAFMRTYCLHSAVKERCIKTIAEDVKSCVPEETRPIYPYLAEMLQLFLADSCRGDEDVVAHYIYAASVHGEAFESCKNTMDSKVRSANTAINSTLASIEYFKAFDGYTKCFLGHLADGSDVKEKSSAFLTGMMKGLHCVNYDGVTAPCETIVNEVHQA